MKKTAVLFVLSLIISFTFSNCNKDESSPSEPPAPVCDQTCQDENLAYGMVDVFWFVWNQNIAGQPTGAKDITVEGPQGGTVHVTGTTAVASNGINTMHLVLEFNYCKGIKEKYNLMFNGTMGADGTFSTTHYAITYSSQMLNYTGTVGKDNWVTQVDGGCTVTINQTLPSVSGTICGRTFSY